MLKTNFTHEDACRASEVWGANCGPGAIAAALGLTLDEVRPHMGNFEGKHYTNPTLMWQVLRSLGARFSYTGGHLSGIFPVYGLARIQWEGPWTEPGANPRWAYRQTHWVASALDRGQRFIFDINALIPERPTGWITVEEWSSSLVPWLIKECVPRANGRWYVTHSVEIEGRQAFG